MSFGDLGSSELTAINRRNEERLAKVSYSMTQTQQTIAETEEIGLNIMDEMEQQSEQLVSTRDGVKETQSFSKMSRSIIKGMTNRAWRKKCCLNLSVVALALANLTVVYYGYLKTPPKH
jgi:vesicle transport through interaction with t-SNAREs 1